jgi:hypothetical protein
MLPDINVPAAVHDDRYPDPIWADIALDIPTAPPMPFPSASFSASATP